VRGLLAAIRIAVLAIARSKLRAALTILGILIGVSAVVIVVALGTGTRDAVMRSFATLGANIIYIWPQATQTSGVRQASMGHMTEADAEVIAREAQSVATVVPFSGTAVQVILGDRNWPTTAMGVTRSYLTVRRFEIARSSGVGTRWASTCASGATRTASSACSRRRGTRPSATTRTTGCSCPSGASAPA
jgi:putative ABC transport system permease protein